MNDSEKMGTEGTKLFWQLFTTSIKCRGMSESTIQRHIMNYKLFMYWARLHGKKLLIQRMFFVPQMTPYKLIEEMLGVTSRLARYGREVHGEENSVDFAWKEIFRTRLCYIQGLLDPNNKEDKFNSPADVCQRIIDIETDWKVFFEKAKYNLL